mmetsp:Transcript_32639/g.56731  ORF Transcript_32639/g.56731 Transcript_32639/m.56731 type:complete len:376 (+) Transcript_32639:3042-4169(+)
MEYGSQVIFVFTCWYIFLGLFSTSDDLEHNIKAGLLAVCLVFIAQSSIKPYHSPFSALKERWKRVAARISLLYIGFLVFLIFQHPKHARAMFAFIDPSLNKELPTHYEYYDRDCEFTASNMYKLSDHYVLAHFVNWMLAAFIIRDYALLHIWQVLDEVIELSLKNIRPNFAECWWDSLILDVLLANTIGIYIGMKILQLFGYRIYDWFGKKDTKSWKEWKFFWFHRHFQGVFLVLIFVSFNFVTGFTVSNSLWIPSNHNINIVRLVVWFLAGYLGFQEAYDDVETWGLPIRRDVNIQAQHRWTAWLMVFLEVGISIKMREQAGNILDATVPRFVVGIWAGISVVCLVYWAYLRFFYKNRIYKDGTLMTSSRAKTD